MTDLELIEQYENSKFVDFAQNNSPLGRLTKGTQYGNYAFNNKVLRDDTTFIKKKNNNKYTHIKFNIKIGGSIYGVWEDNKNGAIFEFEYTKGNNTKNFEVLNLVEELKFGAYTGGRKNILYSAYQETI